MTSFLLSWSGLLSYFQPNFQKWWGNIDRHGDSRKPKQPLPVCPSVAQYLLTFPAHTPPQGREPKILLILAFYLRYLDNTRKTSFQITTLFQSIKMSLIVILCNTLSLFFATMLVQECVLSWNYSVQKGVRVGECVFSLNHHIYISVDGCRGTTHRTYEEV